MPIFELGHVEEGWPPLEINDRPSITMKASAEASSWLEELLGVYF